MNHLKDRLFWLIISVHGLRVHGSWACGKAEHPGRESVVEQGVRLTAAAKERGEGQKERDLFIPFKSTFPGLEMTEW